VSALLAVLLPAAASAAEPLLDVDAPRLWHRGSDAEVRVAAESLGFAPRHLTLALERDDGVALGPRTVRLDDTDAEPGAPARTVRLPVPADLPSGPATLVVSVAGGPDDVPISARLPVRVVTRWWALGAFAPPLIAIGLALAFRQVIPALVLGVLAGAIIRADFAVGTALLRVLDHDLVQALAETGDADKGHLKIVLFTLLLGGMVGLVARSGGAAGLVQAASRWARTRRSGQVAGWAAGLIIFFDDYANTLVVGPSLRPLTDRLRISREKLAFVVDATAAPIASVALISTWVGYEVGLIGDALETTRLAGADPYALFLQSLAYRFYAWLMLGFVLLVAISRRDFGPMAAAEARAAGGEVLRAGSQPLSRTEEVDAAAAPGLGRALLLGLAPIAAVAGVTFTALWWTGRSALAEAGAPTGTLPAWRVLASVRRLGEVLGEAASFDALLYGAAAGVLVALAAAVALRRLRLDDALRAFTDGVGSMVLAVVILTLAWMIGGVCQDLGTAEAAVQLIGAGLPLRLLPAAVFVVSAAIAFATGSSWTTMAVLVPVALPLAAELSAGIPAAAATEVVVAATGAVLTGAVFGDHCSPLSDTTVMSSLAAGCDHLDHVRTQVVYALVVGGVSLLVGDLAVGFGVPPWLGIAAGLAVLALLVRLLGRRNPPVASEEPARPAVRRRPANL
jgi:Na+/H+ antiporter NhaC